MASDPSAVVAAAETPRLVAAIRRRADLYDAILALEQAVARPGAGREGEWIATCLDAVFAAVPYCLDLIGAARIETDPARIRAFRPKT